MCWSLSDLDQLHGYSELANPQSQTIRAAEITLSALATRLASTSIVFNSLTTHLVYCIRLRRKF